MAALAAALAAVACAGKPQATASKPPPPEKPNAVTYTDITKAAGIGFVHTNGARGRKYLPETMGSGLVVFDYDGDDRPDLFFVNSEEWPGNHGKPAYQALYRNRGDGTFEDTTAKAGLKVEAYAIGAAAADYDNDGDEDLYVNALGPDHLFRNRGDGTFEDVSEKARVLDPTGKSLGVVALDYDDDGFIDLAVANDTQPNFLYHNRGNGTFEEIGRTAGIAFSEEGKARGAMGIDAADYDGSGRESLVIGNFSNEMLALYHNEGRGLFIDDAAAAGIGQPSLLTLAFGCFFFDYDLDGRLDIFVANGHVENEIEAVQPSVTYAEPPHLFRGGPDSRFEETTAKVGSDLAVPRVARGAATADFDGDGDLDIAVTTNNGPAALFRNDGGSANGFVRLKLVGGGASNRDAIGARVTLTSNGRTQVRTVRSAASYASQSEMVLTFGLGPAAAGALTAEVRWPDGTTARFDGLVPGRTLTLKQGEKAPR
jgi:hypothetical protein